MKRSIALIAAACLGLLACAHAPTKPGERADLVSAANATLARMEAQDPGLRPLIDRSVGYIVFPEVGEGGLFIGGGGGAGVVYEHGVQTGFATVEHLSAGALAGGQKYAELVIVNDPNALQDMKSGRFDFGAKAQAVIVRSGASANTTFEKGVAVFVEPLRGAMLNASITGQRIRLTL